MGTEGEAPGKDVLGKEEERKGREGEDKERGRLLPHFSNHSF